jgi:hypothetical protein
MQLALVPSPLREKVGMRGNIKAFPVGILLTPTLSPSVDGERERVFIVQRINKTRYFSAVKRQTRVARWWVKRLNQTVVSL